MRQPDLQHIIHHNSPVSFLFSHETTPSAHFPTPSSQCGISSHLPFCSLPLLAEVCTRSRKTSTTTCGAASGSGPQTGYDICQHTSLIILINTIIHKLSYAKVLQYGGKQTPAHTRKYSCSGGFYFILPSQAPYEDIQEEDCLMSPAGTKRTSQSSYVVAVSSSIYLFIYLFISLNSWFMTNWHAKCERGVIANQGKKRKERNIEKEKKEG